MKNAAFILAFAVLISVAFAQVTDAQLRFISGMNDLCVMLTSVLPIITILLFVIAAVAYGAGQIFGAEMRSRATSWATTMVVGAIIALLIWMLAKPILGIFSPDIANLQNFCTPNY
jgi:accessory gene regulator protein AgrB